MFQKDVTRLVTRDYDASPIIIVNIKPIQVRSQTKQERVLVQRNGKMVYVITKRHKQYIKW